MASGWEQQADARLIIQQHGGVCHWCGQPGADQIDHVIPVAEGGADTLANKRPIHAMPCHADKTRQESKRARAKQSLFRPAERHPGLIGLIEVRKYSRRRP